MSQWAEVRHLHVVEGVPKKEIARRFKLDVKTVRRAIGRSMPPVRVSPPRPGTLDPWRERIKQWLCEEPRLTAKRIRRLLLPMAGPVPARTVRRYVAGLRTAVRLKEAFVHRSVRPGTTMEVDFGESWVDIAGTPCKVKYLVATLPFSNAYFAKAYPVERVESLLDGIESAFRYFGGLVDRLVLDNTSLAVKDVLAGRDRVQTEAFDAFRGGYPFRAEFSAPAKGWEKGSVEGGVKYVRNLVFRPRLAVDSSYDEVDERRRLAAGEIRTLRAAANPGPADRRRAALAEDGGAAVPGGGQGRRRRAGDRPLGAGRAGVRAHEPGASTTDVMLAGNWKTSRMVAHYSAGATAERGAVARYL